jgi:hypothetical protein
MPIAADFIENTLLPAVASRVDFLCASAFVSVTLLIPATLLSLFASYLHPPELQRNSYNWSGSASGQEVSVKKIVLAIVAVSLYVPALSAFADTLELKNGSVIKGTFIGGSEAQLSFRVGSTVQRYPVADVLSLRFDGDSGRSAN